MGLSIVPSVRSALVLAIIVPDRFLKVALVNLELAVVELVESQVLKVPSRYLTPRLGLVVEARELQKASAFVRAAEPLEPK